MIRRLVFLLLMTALIVCAGLFISSGSRPTPEPSAPASSLSTRPDDRQALFPGLEPADVSAVRVTTPQSAFDMRRSENRRVSINGHLGDEDVFSTMLAHIAAMDFTSTPPFSATETPLLTLVVHQRGEEFTASFYADGRNGEHARIIAGQEHARVYGLTNGWYVGTLMLACEGTRIQDESGQEIPAE